MSVNQNDYHRRREAQERALAARSTDESARRLHLELARRHAERVDESTPAAPPMSADAMAA